MTRGFLPGFILGLLTIAGCATVFPWRYYNSNIPERKITEQDVGKSLSDLAYDEGILLGKSGSGGWPDAPLNQCKPDPLPSPGASPSPVPDELKCVTVLVDDFYSLKADDEKCHANLQTCQQGAAPQ